MWKAVGKFIEELSGVLKEPPYLLFTFIGGVFVIFSLVTQNNFEQTWTLFIYAVVGTIWRYAAKDFLTWSGDHTILVFKKKLRWKLVTHIIFHAGNVGWCLALMFRLGII